LSQERRSHQRKKSKLNRLLRARYGEEQSDEAEGYLFLVDMSLAGMRVNLEAEISQGSEVSFQLPLQAFGAELPPILEVRCQVRWTRRLRGGTWVHGLEFQTLSEETMSVIGRVLEKFDEQGGRQTFRLEYPMQVEAVIDDVPARLSLRDISATGLGFRFRGRVSAEQSLMIHLPLEGYSLETEAVVQWSREVEGGICEFGCIFPDLEEDEAREIREFILKNS
jgi:c-di-GMP-binding flagellar brake protein YcgR